MRNGAGWGGAAPLIKAKRGLPSSISLVFVPLPTIDRPLIRNNERIRKISSAPATACRIRYTGSSDTRASSDDSEYHALRHLPYVYGPHHVQRLGIFNMVRRCLRTRLLQSRELQPDVSHIPPCYCRRFHHCAHRPL